MTHGQGVARNAHREAHEKLTVGQRIADKVAKWNGSWSYVLSLVALIAGWSTVMAKLDPYPYQFFNLVLAIMVVMQGPLIVMSQNRQEQKSAAKAQADFELDQKTERLLEHVHNDVQLLVEHAGLKKGAAE